MLCGGCKQQFVAIVDTLTSTARIQNPMEGKWPPARTNKET
jgi:hypothetical protein